MKGGEKNMGKRETTWRKPCIVRLPEGQKPSDEKKYKPKKFTVHL